MMIFQKNQGINSLLEISEVVIPDNYEERMLTHCRFKHILPSEIREMDGEKSMYVKIDGLSPLIARYSRKSPNKEDIKHLMVAVNKCIRELREFLLNPNGIIISMDYIFFSDITDDYKFIYIPGNTFDFKAEIKNLFEDIMRLYDHKDSEGVKYLYDTYSQIIRDNFTIDMFTRLTTDKGSSSRLCIEKKSYEEPEEVISEDIYVEPYVYKSSPVNISYNPKEYIAVFAVAVLIMLVMLVIFGPSSLRFSILSFLMAIVFTIADINHKKNEAELEETFKGAKNEFKEKSITSVSENIPERKVQGTTILTPDSSDAVSKLIPTGKQNNEEIEQIYLIEGATRIGRLQSECDVVINDASVSRLHAVIERHGEVVTLMDMGSTNGTYINDSRLDEGRAVTLNHGDTIGIAAVRYECV